jgi:subtilisin family serine protease
MTKKTDDGVIQGWIESKMGKSSGELRGERMGSEQQHRRVLAAVLFSAVVMLADVSALVLGEVDEPQPATHVAPILIEGLPPLMCGDDLCLRPTRMIERGERPSEEPDMWWLSYGPDLDWNGMDDRLQRVLDGHESISPTAIIGPDGRKTVAIVVDYAWAPNEEEVNALVSVLDSHGWIGAEQGAWFQVMSLIDSVVVDKVPVSALMDIYMLPGVVVVEMQNVMVPFNGVASEAARAMPSDVYTASAYSRGYTGEGVVIAVLDTGVDNEHRALNDFDDIDDEPDSDATSYNDQKWVAGYDATSTASNPDGTVDPDDGQGHGTHVAATALGTGGAQRVHTGTGMGAYLVDIKVLTDAGGTNSQSSLNGIQWMINNKDTDWGNNESSRGIDVASMSFGSVGSPLNPDDEGDNGSGAEARLVNDARDAGIVCVVAMGNDGSKRVPSPASADGAISIGAVNDRNTVNRTDDVVATYSNYGPRLSDGDDDEWDELKPDLTAFGTAIMSATAATGPSFPGQPERPLADNEYDAKDGTSMATPVVSGIVAIMLQADDTLDPEDIRNILRNSSESRGSASEPSVSNRWNDKWGFGLVDASCALDKVLGRACTPLEDNGGVIVDPPPGGDGLGHDVEMSSPTNQSLYLAGKTLSVEGTTDVSEHAYVEVQVKFEQFYEDGESTELTNWMRADGTVEEWYLDITVDDDWVNPDESHTLVYARSLNAEGEASMIELRIVRFARMSVSIKEPALGTPLVGLVGFEGVAEGTEHDRIEYKIDNGDWVLGDSLTYQEEGSQDWSFNWDSTEVSDGSHRISVRMVNASDVASDVLKRTYEVDNLPAAPDFAFAGSVGVYDGGLPVNSAVAGTVLEVRFGLRNIGDLDANEVYLTLEGAGSPSSTYPSEGKVTSLEEGESVQVTLYWWATEAGTHDVTLSLDPTQQYNDPDRSNNIYTFSFVVDERPLQPMLRFLPGSARTQPEIPAPGTPFDIQLRVDNLGQGDATNLNVGLERWMDGIGWQRLDDQGLNLVPGSSTTSGYSFVRFADIVDEEGAVSYRAVLSGSGVEPAYSESRFNVTVGDLYIGSKVGVSLATREVPVEFVGLEEGGLMFTTKDGELFVRTVTSTLTMPGSVMLEEAWGGELAAYQRDDGLVQVAWTRRSLSVEGYVLTDIAMTSISAAGKTTPKHYHMQPLKLSEGAYYGFNFDQYDGKMVLAGYHRDLSTSGSWQDITSLFVISSSTPDKGNSWGNPVNVLSDIDIRPADAQPLGVGLGEEHLHLVYQEYREDVTGIERVGLMYTHGPFDSSSWSFQYSIGDEAAHPQLEVLVDDDEDHLVMAWIEGQGKAADVVTVSSNSVWSNEQTHRTNAPGVSHLSFTQREEGIFLFHDEINMYGPVSRMGLVANSDGTLVSGLSNMLFEGFTFGVGLMESDTIVCTVTPSGSYSLSKVVSLKGSSSDVGSPSFLDTLFDYLPGGSDEAKFRILGLSVVVLIGFLFVVVVVLRRSHTEMEELEALLEEDQDAIELMITPEHDEGPLLMVDDEDDVLTVHETPVALMDEDESLSDELAKKVESGEGNARLERRMKRKQQREMGEMAKALQQGLPPLPLPGALPLEGLPAPAPAPMLPLPDLKRDAQCPSCQATFSVKDLMLKRTTCPVCQTKFDL